MRKAEQESPAGKLEECRDRVLEEIRALMVDLDHDQLEELRKFVRNLSGRQDNREPE